MQRCTCSWMCLCRSRTRVLLLYLDRFVRNALQVGELMATSHYNKLERRTDRSRDIACEWHHVMLALTGRVYVPVLLFCLPSQRSGVPRTTAWVATHHQAVCSTSNPRQLKLVRCRLPVSKPLYNRRPWSSAGCFEWSCQELSLSQGCGVQRLQSSELRDC